MSFWSKVKRAFSSGGVKIRMDVPPAFRWSDETLPVMLELTNSTDEPRTVNAFRIAILAEEFEEEGRSATSVSVGTGGRSTRRGRRPDDTNEMGGFRYRIEQPITIRPGETVNHTIDVPLSAQQVGIELGDDAPGWLGKAADMLDQARDWTARTTDFYVLLRTEVDGFSTTSLKNQKIRHLKPNEKMTSWSPKFGTIRHD